MRMEKNTKVTFLFTCTVDMCFSIDSLTTFYHSRKRKGAENRKECGD